MTSTLTLLKAGGDPARAKVEASEGPTHSMLNSSGSSRFFVSNLVDEKPVKALEIQPLYARHVFPQNEIIFLSKLADLFGMKILEL